MSDRNHATVATKVNISMVSLKWGDALSTLLPGAVALFAIAPYFQILNDRIANIDKVGPAAGVALLMAAALAGGMLEAVTRISWEKYWLVRRCPPPKDVLLRLNSQNIDLYERGVQSSYKYVTFYSNFAWATTLLLLRHLRQASPWSVGTLILVVSIGILLRASHVQWTYFVNYQDKVFRQRSTCVAE